MTTEGPLAGITIVDLTRVLAGPYCTMLAADMGARVIKIERPDRGDDTRAWGPPFLEGESAYYLSINRNKESVALDFKRPEGRSILEALIARADVLVENFRPDTLAAAGFGYPELATRHPQLVYVSISGFGQTGPRRGEANYDAVAQAEGGLMSVTGLADGPGVRLGVAIADLAAGMFAYQGMLAALLARARSGRGQLVDVGMLDAVTALLSYQAGRYFATGEVPSRTGNRHATIAPYDTFEAADGTLVLAVGNDDQWRRLCQIPGVPDLSGESRFATNDARVRHYDDLRPVLAAAFRTRSVETWIDALRAAGVPCGRVRSIDEALGDPQLAARAMIETLEHPTIGDLRVLGSPVKLSDTPASVRTPPPRLGEHTRRVLQHDLGLDERRIVELAKGGIVAIRDGEEAGGARAAGTRRHPPR